MNAQPAKKTTLALDIGGTGLKAALLDAAGHMISERLRTPTSYPMGPQELVHALTSLVAPLGTPTRAAAGFPGVIRGGLVLTAPHFVTKHGPGTAVDKALVKRWTEFDLDTELQTALHCPVRVVNDAEMQALPVITGSGVEVVVTLGTGVGSATYQDGVCGPHLELAHHLFHGTRTYNEYLGEAARHKVGSAAWRTRIVTMVEVLRTLFSFDHLYIGGGNSTRLDHPKVLRSLGANVSLIDPNDGLIGAHFVWQHPGPVQG